jgi:nitrogen regulatory protein P-II 1
VKLEIVVSNDHYLNLALNIIKEQAKTGKIGDGKIFVSDITKTIRIRTGEEDEDAL